ncbi:MAG TPA: urea transporter, partial [Cyclobacteriaceae bacterium]|nr:urea transporter [Cyclobacteriaceae bacterium]
ILFFAGVFINTPLSALYGLAGAVLSGLLGYSFASNQAFANGLLSYNGVLCAIVFAGKKKEDGYRAFAAVLLSLVFTILMMEFHILVLTFPFVLASGLVLYVRDQQTNTLA